MKRLELILTITLCILQMTSSGCAADSPLGVFGNANMDDTINEKDIASHISH